MSRDSVTNQVIFKDTEHARSWLMERLDRLEEAVRDGADLYHTATSLTAEAMAQLEGDPMAFRKMAVIHMRDAEAAVDVERRVADAARPVQPSAVRGRAASAAFIYATLLQPKLWRWLLLLPPSKLQTQHRLHQLSYTRVCAPQAAQQSDTSLCRG